MSDVIFTNEQLDVINDPNKYCIVIASAGSGKTHVLAERTRHLIETENISPSRILCFTFSRAGVKAMSKNIENKDIEIKTMHSFGLNLIKDFNENKNKSVRVLDGEELLSRLNMSEYGRIKPGDLADKIQEARSRGLTPTSETKSIEEYCSIHDNLRGKAGLFKLAFESYMEKLDTLHSQGLYDMADLIVLPLQRLKEDEVFRASVQNKYDAILVDEYQDTSVAQQQLIDLIRKPENFLFVVGDDKQCIYQWRGAYPEMIRKLADKLGVKPKLLSRNFRSTQQITDSAMTVLDRIPEEQKMDNGKQGDIPEFIPCNGQEEKYNSIINRIKILGDKRESQGLSRYGNEIIVLARNNKEVKAITESLRKAGIPIVKPNKAKEWTGKILKLYSWIKGEEPNSILLQMKDDESCNQALKDLSTSGLIRGDEINNYLRENTEPGTTANTLANANPPKTIGEAIAMAVNDFKLFGEEDLEDLRKIYVEFKGLNETGICNKLNSLTFESHDEGIEKTDEDAVSVQTIHKVKGLEYESVILVVDNGDFPRQGRAVTEEELNIFYVAMTRAKNNLYIISDTRKGISPILKYHLDPDTVKGLEPYSNYQKKIKNNEIDNESRTIEVSPLYFDKFLAEEENTRRIVDMNDFLKNNLQNAFYTSRKSYPVKASMIEDKTKVIDEITGKVYETGPEKVLIEGPEGERLVLPLSFVQKNYMLENGDPVTKEYLKENGEMKNLISLDLNYVWDKSQKKWETKRINTNNPSASLFKEYIAIPVPPDVSLSVKSNDGIEKVNERGFKHGEGDFLVFEKYSDRSIDFKQDIKVVNGIVFNKKYQEAAEDMRLSDDLIDASLNNLKKHIRDTREERIKTGKDRNLYRQKN